VYIQLTTLCLDDWGCVFEGYGSDFWVGVIDFGGFDGVCLVKPSKYECTERG